MPEEVRTQSKVSRGLGGLRHPGTQLVYLRQDRGSNRPESWLNHFLVAEQSGTVWGHLGPPQPS